VTRTATKNQLLAAGLRARGKRDGIIACAPAHRANRIAYALVRDQTTDDPTQLATTA
jgi:transposase